MTSPIMDDPHDPDADLAGEFPEEGDDDVVAQPSGSGAIRKPAAGLYIVATPIGNAGDITLRALDILRGVDAIACEDTRVTGKLLRRYGIRTRMLPYHDHNAAKMRPVLLDKVANGQSIALVSDAGTPLVSDPGFKLVREAKDRGLALTHLPGANAAITALVLSGLPSDRFLFGGFLPSKSAARRTELDLFRTLPATLIFYESAQRLAEMLGDVTASLGAREVAVARELTKLFEEVRRGPAAELAQHYTDKGPPKGEVVVVVGPPAADAAANDAADMDSLLRQALTGGMSVRDAAAHVATITGQPKKQVYARALQLGTGGDDPA
ncbi:16S rRNA (cytidine(1402)-2'-O)-methyltransferase [Niveispirillum sp. KHB5.9]|uniref:16S rRNA (cytidine(1402)-2'-O)-methyltransferase n=1 Tax=Niveispirillum sp. KHB5.9 TaxID=3400269 RepID=UPI003A87212C